MTASTIARLKVTLDDVEPKVQRRIEVPADIALSGKLLPGLSVVVNVDSRTGPKGKDQ